MIIHISIMFIISSVIIRSVASRAANAQDLDDPRPGRGSEKRLRSIHERGIWMSEGLIPAYGYFQGWNS